MPARSPTRYRARGRALRRAAVAAAAVTALALVPLAAAGPPAGAAAPPRRGARAPGHPADHRPGPGRGHRLRGRAVLVAGAAAAGPDPAQLRGRLRLAELPGGAAGRAGPRRTRRPPLRRPAVPGRARRHRPVAAGHRDRVRGRRDRAGHVHLPGCPALGERGWPRCGSRPTRAISARPRPSSTGCRSRGLARMPSGSRSAPALQPADGAPVQRYRVDGGPWHALPADRAFYAGSLRPGRHQVAVLDREPRGRLPDPVQLARRAAEQYVAVFCTRSVTSVSLNTSGPAASTSVTKNELPPVTLCSCSALMPLAAACVTTAGKLNGCNPIRVTAAQFDKSPSAPARGCVGAG